MTDYQTSQSQQLQRSLWRSRLLWVVLVGVAVAAVASLGYWHYRNDQKSHETTTLVQDITQANTLRSQLKFSQAEALLSGFITTAKQPTNKYNASIALANIYATADDYPSAITAYQKAASYTKPSYNTAYGQALSADAEGNKTAAITYYTQALTFLSTTAPGNGATLAEQQAYSSAQDDRESIEFRIEQLKANP